MLYNQHINPLQLPQLRTTKTAEESKAINSLQEPAIIISASGMADAGRILHHLKHNLWRPEASVLFVGYQAEGSLGRSLLDGAQKVRILGEEISVKAKIYNLDGFSAHADMDQLYAWLSHFVTRPTVFLVHGEPAMSEPFAARIADELKLDAVIPNYGDIVTIEGRAWSLTESGFVLESGAVRALRDFLAQMQREFCEHAKRLERMVTENPNQLSTILRHLNKLNAHIKKMIKSL